MPVGMLTARSGRFDNQELALDTLQSMADMGLSPVINDIHRLVLLIGALAAMVERFMSAPAPASTPMSASRPGQGRFGAHWDDHDVLVLQVHGRKCCWFCYGKRDAYPMKGALAATKIGDAEELLWSEVLEPGDIPYIPRGEIPPRPDRGWPLHST